MKDVQERDSEFVDRLIPVFRQQGYGVEEVSDARYDLILRRGGEKTIVTCKAGHASMVSARFVRNVQQTQTAQHAAGAKVITCGSFAPGAARYQRTSSIELIDGHKLIRLLDDARKSRERPDDFLLPFGPSSGDTLPRDLATDSNGPACPARRRARSNPWSSSGPAWSNGCGSSTPNWRSLPPAVRSWSRNSPCLRRSLSCRLCSSRSAAP
jgi:hypothetical protein